jgi:cytochrome b561
MPIKRYSKVAVVLHWLIAGLIIANVTLAWTWDLLPKDDMRPVIDIHKSIGISVLGLVLMRVLWRMAHRPPAFPMTYRPWERTLSHVVHGLLYGVMLGLPLSGWIMDSAWKDAASHPMYWFGLFEWPRIGAIMHLAPDVRLRIHALFGAAHSLSADALYGLLFLHIAGALKHQFIDGERELQRMSLRR